MCAGNTQRKCRRTTIQRAHPDHCDIGEHLDDTDADDNSSSAQRQREPRQPQQQQSSSASAVSSCTTTSSSASSKGDKRSAQWAYVWQRSDTNSILFNLSTTNRANLCSDPSAEPGSYTAVGRDAPLRLHVVTTTGSLFAQG